MHYCNLKKKKIQKHIMSYDEMVIAARGGGIGLGPPHHKYFVLYTYFEFNHTSELMNLIFNYLFTDIGRT